MDLFSWLGNPAPQRRSGPSQRRRHSRLGVLEELEARTLPNDCFLSLLHASQAAADAVTATQPEPPACVRVDPLEQDAFPFGAFGLPLPLPSGNAALARSALTTTPPQTRGPTDNGAPNGFAIALSPGDSFPAARTQAGETGFNLFAGNPSDHRGGAGYGAGVGLMAYGSGSNDSAANASIFLPAAHSIRNETQAQRKFPGNTGASHLSPAGNQDGNLPAHVLVGYLHNFDNGAARVRVATVSPDFDVINVAFATAAPGSTSRIEFSVDPVLGTPTQFQSEVRSAQAQGKIVNLSIGGANSPVLLNNDTDLANFVTSVSSVVQNYGFNGIDIDFEGNSVILNPGDTDFRNPTTPSVVNLISALHQLKAQFGPDFVISMAPETLFVQAGIVAYGGPYGAYLPVVYGTQDILSYVHVQDYNSGPMQALDGRIYTQGNADFHVAMTEMLLQGFPIAGDPNRVFPSLPPAQVAFGVPASPSAGQGYTPPGDLEKALDYLINHNSFGGSYQLMDPLGYTNMLGMMTWSINWDASNGFQVSRRIGQFLHGLA